MKRRHLYLSINLLLGLLILVMINLVSTNSYFKSDLTRSNSYSLSRVSKETLRMVEDPLRVKIFYNKDVPAPYNGVRRYIADLMREYKGYGNRYFSYEFVDPATPEGKEQADSYGLRQARIQEIRSDQFQSKSVYMGAAVLYGNTVETIDQVTTTDGVEYRFTTAMRSAITQVDALSGAEEKVQMKVIASPSLSSIQIEGFNRLEETLTSIYEEVNSDNYNRLDFEYLEPAGDAGTEDLMDRYGLEPLTWRDPSGERRRALLDIVLSYRDRTERVPINILSGLLGGYSLEKPEKIEEAVRQGLHSLVMANPRLAYATGHGEKPLRGSQQQTPQQTAQAFAGLAGRRFELQPVNPAEEDIPSDIDTLIVNGPTEGYSEEALYRIDQFVMNGGSLFILLDRQIQKIPSQQEMMAGRRPTWEENSSGIEELLAHWGADVTTRFVLDEECYQARANNRMQRIFQAPLLTGKSINRDHVVTSGLENIIFYNATEITSVDEKSESSAYTSLLRTSRNGWTVEDPSTISPNLQGAPSSAETGRRDLAVLLESEFESYFEEPVQLELPREEPETIEEPERQEGPESPEENSRQAGEEVQEGEAPSLPEVSTARFRRSSTGTGRIIVVSTSAITTSQLLDPQQRSPNGTLLMNSIDYLNGSPGFAELRSKGLGVPRFDTPPDAFRITARWGNTILVPILVLIIGLFVWSRRRARSRRVREMFTTNSEASS